MDIARSFRRHAYQFTDINIASPETNTVAIMDTKPRTHGFATIDNWIWFTYINTFIHKYIYVCVMIA